MDEQQQPTVPRYCATCRHLYRRAVTAPRAEWRCTAPKGQQVDMVTGAVTMAGSGECAMLRATGAWCGVEGRWWEAAVKAEKE